MLTSDVVGFAARTDLGPDRKLFHTRTEEADQTQVQPELTCLTACVSVGRGGDQLHADASIVGTGAPARTCWGRSGPDSSGPVTLPPRTIPLLMRGVSLSGERPYSCDICIKTFTRQQSLNEHKNRHYGRTPFECKICGKGAALRFLSDVPVTLVVDSSCTEPLARAGLVFFFFLPMISASF